MRNGWNPHVGRMATSIAGTNIGLNDRNNDGVCRLRYSAHYWSTNFHGHNKRDRFRCLVQVYYIDSYLLPHAASGKAVKVKKEANINDTLKLFQKPFDYLFNGDYISPQQKAELRQMAIDSGLIQPSTSSVPQSTTQPKGTYS